MSQVDPTIEAVAALLLSRVNAPESVIYDVARTIVEEIAVGDTKAFDTLVAIGPALLVLRNMCRHAGLKLGEEKAKEMIVWVREVIGGPIERAPEPVQEALSL